eukprot:7385508-Prymnesium_polylepis.1
MQATSQPELGSGGFLSCRRPHAQARGCSRACHPAHPALRWGGRPHSDSLRPEGRPVSTWVSSRVLVVCPCVCVCVLPFYNITSRYRAGTNQKTVALKWRGGGSATRKSIR